MAWSSKRCPPRAVVETARGSYVIAATMTTARALQRAGQGIPVYRWPLLGRREATHSTIQPLWGSTLSHLSTMVEDRIVIRSPATAGYGRRRDRGGDTASPNKTLNQQHMGLSGVQRVPFRVPTSRSLISLRSAVRTTAADSRGDKYVPRVQKSQTPTMSTGGRWSHHLGSRFQGDVDVVNNHHCLIGSMEPMEPVRPSRLRQVKSRDLGPMELADTGQNIAILSPPISQHSVMRTARSTGAARVNAANAATCTERSENRPTGGATLHRIPRAWGC